MVIQKKSSSEFYDNSTAKEYYNGTLRYVELENKNRRFFEKFMWKNKLNVMDVLHEEAIGENTRRSEFIEYKKKEWQKLTIELEKIYESFIFDSTREMIEKWAPFSNHTIKTKKEEFKNLEAEMYRVLEGDEWVVGQSSEDHNVLLQKQKNIAEKKHHIKFLETIILELEDQNRNPTELWNLQKKCDYFRSNQWKYRQIEWEKIKEGGIEKSRVRDVTELWFSTNETYEYNWKIYQCEYTINHKEKRWRDYSNMWAWCWEYAIQDLADPIIFIRSIKALELR